MNVNGQAGGRGFRIAKWMCDVDTYQHLVSKGFQIMEDMNNAEIVRLIKEACSTNNVGVINAMIANGLKTKWVYSDHNYCPYKTPFEAALATVSDDQLDLVKLFVEAGCPLNKSAESYSNFWSKDDVDGNSVLSLAVNRKLCKITEYLIVCGANVDQATMEAAGSILNRDIIAVLLEANTDLNWFHGSILQAAITSCDNEHSESQQTFHKRQLTMIESLLNAGVNPNIKTEQGLSMGHVAILEWMSDQQRCSILNLLLKYGFNVNVCDFKLQTLLHLAAEKGDEEIIHFLIKRGANINTQDEQGRSPLLMLVKNFHVANSKLLRVFIEHGVDINAEDKNGDCVFHRLLLVHKPYTVDICHVLKATEVKLNFSNAFTFGVAFFEILQWSVLSSLLQAGCTDPRLLDAILDRAVRDNVENGIHLVTHAMPLHMQSATQPRCDMGAMSQLLAEYAEYKSTKKPVSALKIWCAYQLRRHLFTVTEGRSIYLRLQELTQPSQMPSELARFVTLECFYVDDRDRPPNSDDDMNAGYMPPLPLMMLNAMLMNNGPYSSNESGSDNDLMSTDDELMSPITFSDSDDD